MDIKKYYIACTIGNIQSSIENIFINYINLRCICEHLMEFWALFNSFYYLSYNALYFSYSSTYGSRGSIHEPFLCYTLSEYWFQKKRANEFLRYSSFSSPN